MPINSSFNSLLVLILITYSCKSPVEKVGDETRDSPVAGVHIRISLPIVMGEKVIAYNDSLDIFYRGNDILYCIPYLHDDQHTYLDSLGNTKKEENHFIVRYRYFIYSQRHAYGFLCDSLALKSSRKILVDSFLIKYGPPVIQLNENFYQTHHLVDSLFAEGVWQMKYFPTGQKTVNTEDTAYLYFANNSPVLPHSLVRPERLLHGWQLVEIRSIQNAVRNSGGIKILPKREFRISMRIASSKDSVQLALFFNEFRVKQIQ